MGDRGRRADDVALDGLKVALARATTTTSPGRRGASCCTSTRRARPAQREALAGSSRGALGGDALKHFPWAWKASERLAVRPVEIEVSHEPRRQWLRIRDHVTRADPRRLRGRRDRHVRDPRPRGDAGRSSIADELRVDDGPLRFEFRGNCGYSARFDYAG